MAATKGGFTFNFLSNNTAQENNVSKGMGGPAPSPPTPLLSEKNNFRRCTLPSDIIDLLDDGVQNPRDPHQHLPPGKLHQTPLINQPQPGFPPHLMPSPTGQQNVRINQPDVSSLNFKMLPQMGPYQPEPLLGRINQSGLVFSNRSGTVSHTGSPSISELLGTGRSRPEMGPYRAVQQQSIANESNIRFSSYSMPPHTMQLERTIPLDSGFSSLNFGMPPQPVTTSSQIGSFQMDQPDYSRTGPDMGFPSSVMSHLTGSSHSEYPNGSTNESCMGFSNMVMQQLESGTGTGFPNLVATQTQVDSSQISAFLTTPHKEPGSTDQEQRLYQEMVSTEEVATNQVTAENQNIDLNKTPQQKSRRRKYVPKVVTPGKKPRAPRKTTPKKPSEDRPKRKYVRKKGVEPPPVETPVNANGAGTQNVANLQSNPTESPNWQNKTNDLPASSTLNAATMQNEPTEASNSCTPSAVNGNNNPGEVPMPCTPNVTNGLSNRIDISSSCTPKSAQGANTGGMSGLHKSARRCLNFDAEEVRPNGSQNAQSQPNLNPVSAAPARTNVSTFPITNSSFQAGPSPSKGIALDLNSSASQWQEEFDRLFPSAPSAPSPNVGGANEVLGMNQTPVRNMINSNPLQSGLGNLTGYPYPSPPRQIINNIAAPTTPLNRCQMGVHQENLAALAKKNDDIILESLIKAAIVPSNSFSNAPPSVTSDGRKRGHGTLVSDTGLTGQVRSELSPRVIETSKKMRIWHGNNTGHDGAITNASLVPNSSSPMPPVKPNGGVFSLADAQRLVELRKRNNAKMLSFRIPDGNNENAPVVTSDKNWFMHQSETSTPVKPAPAVNGTSRAQIYQPGVSIQTFSERTAFLNQFVNASGTQPCTPINPVVSTNQPHVENCTVRNEKCHIEAMVQTISETSEKRVADNSPPPSTPAKSPASNTPPKSEPKRRGRRPNSEKSGSNPPVPPRPKGRPRGKNSPLNSTNLMAGGPAALMYNLELITQKMKALDINRVRETVPAQPCYAMVPYQGGVGNGAMVPYDDGTAKKKKKSRARVDLDPVTNQVWNLLMGKETNDGIETFSENDEKVMEAEREVFRGRVDSFIARMHLVQGDRRFSPWKGSVVDSVVGVFLTQNVSDHLSSSAFMALAAKYPSKTQLLNTQPRQTTLSVSRPPRETNPYARDFINLTKWHRQREVIIEDFTEIGSQVTSEEKDSNESQGSTTKFVGSSPEKKSTGSPDSGPGLIINFSSDDPTCESAVSSQNSVISNQSSPDYLFQTGDHTGLGLFGNYGADKHGGNVTSYTQLLRMAESNVDFFPDLNKETGAVVRSCSYSNVSQFYPQNGNNNYSAASSTINNSNASHLYPQNNGVYSSSAAPAIANGGNRSETSQTQNTEPRIGTTPHSPMVSRTPEPITPMVKISTPSSKQTHGCIPVQEENKLHQVGPTQPPAQQPQPQAQSTPKNTPNANNSNNSKASSETVQGKQPNMAQKAMDGTMVDEGVSSKGRRGKGASNKGKKNDFDWDSLRKAAQPDGVKKERTYKTMDSLDYKALRNASVHELSDAIRERGMNNMLAERIKGFLDRVLQDHGSVDLEWLRDVDPDKAKDYLLSIRGLGLKSVECVRLLTLHHMAFPVDTNVGRICVRLGWVPLQPLPESLQLHLLEMYPILENIQKYLWPRLCKLDQRTLYELHYQMITFGKVFCTKSKPNCNACPMRAECKHFASAFASARLALPAPEVRGLAPPALPAGPSTSANQHPPFPPRVPPPAIKGSLPLPPIQYPTPSNLPFPNRPQSQPQPQIQNSTQTRNEPIIEEPASPEPEPVVEKEIGAIEDAFMEDDPNEIPVINLDLKEFAQNLKNYIQANNLEIEEADMSNAMVPISPAAASIPAPKLKNISRLRTEHHVYELPDNHTLLDGFEPREPDDPCPYLLSVWTPGETAMSTEPPKSLCISQDIREICDNVACSRCVSIKEARSKIVRGTILIPCRTAMRGSFPLNGTYFQVNEVFADHETSRTPVDVSRTWIWSLPRRMVYFGTSIPTIFKGLSTEEIQHCFWRGFVCVRGFDRATRAPRPLYARLHFPASKLAKNSKKEAAAAKDKE